MNKTDVIETPERQDPVPYDWCYGDDNPFRNWDKTENVTDEENVNPAFKGM